MMPFALRALPLIEPLIDNAHRTPHQNRGMRHARPQPPRLSKERVQHHGKPEDEGVAHNAASSRDQSFAPGRPRRINSPE